MHFMSVKGYLNNLTADVNWLGHHEIILLVKISGPIRSALPPEFFNFSLFDLV